VPTIPREPPLFLEGRGEEKEESGMSTKGEGHGGGGGKVTDEKAVKPPKRRPTQRPMAPPIWAPIFTLSMQVGPRLYPILSCS